MQSDIKRLQAMRNILANPSTWTQGAFARDANGEPVHPCYPLVQSLDLAGAHRRQWATEPLPAALWRALDEHGYQFVEQFNDSPRTQHKDVLRLLDRAIAIAQVAK